LTKCDGVGGNPLAVTGEVPRMKRLFAYLAAVIALSLGAVPPASAYIDPGTGSMLLQILGAGVAAAIFYFRELRIKFLSLFSRRQPPASEDGAEASPNDPPR